MLFLSKSGYSLGEIDNRKTASARINIQLIIPRSIKLQSAKNKNSRPHFLFENRKSLNKTELCFERRGIPDYQLLISREQYPENTDFNTAATADANGCHLPFANYTSAQLSRLGKQDRHPLILTVSPL